MWMDECKEAFKKLKKYLVTPQILTHSKLMEVLYFYLTTLDKVVSSVLVKEEKSE